MSTTFAVGDVHGMYDHLIGIFTDIDEHRVDEDYRIVLLGDYVDRGPKSKQVIDFILKKQEELGDKLIVLPGNHERMFFDLFDSVTDPNFDDYLSWYVRNGGDTTLKSYFNDDHPIHNEIWNARDVKDWIEEWREAYPHHYTFLDECLKGKYNPSSQSYYFDEDNGTMYVHAGVVPHKPALHHSSEDYLWSRNKLFLNNIAEWCETQVKRIVHGHTIQDTQYNSKYRVGIDTGAYATGIITCAVINGEELEYLHHENIPASRSGIGTQVKR